MPVSTTMPSPTSLQDHLKRGAAMPLDIQLWDADRAEEHVSELWAIYQAVCAQHSDQMVWHESMFDKHLNRARFRLSVALDDDDTPVAFAWGYTGHRGQWWADRVAEVLGDRVAAQWVGGHFEVVEIAVPDELDRGRVAQRLHDRLLDGLPHAVALISTDDEDGTVSQLLRRRSWTPLGSLTPGWTIWGCHLQEDRVGAAF